MRAPDVARNCSKLLSPVSSDNTRIVRVMISHDDMITPRCRMAGWPGTGETGVIQRRGTPSSNVVGTDEHCGSNG